MLSFLVGYPARLEGGQAFFGRKFLVLFLRRGELAHQFVDGLLPGGVAAGLEFRFVGLALLLEFERSGDGLVAHFGGVFFGLELVFGRTVGPGFELLLHGAFHLLALSFDTDFDAGFGFTVDAGKDGFGDWEFVVALRALDEVGGGHGIGRKDEG